MVAPASHAHAPKPDAVVEPTPVARPSRTGAQRTAFPGPPLVRFGATGQVPPTTLRSRPLPLAPLRPRATVAPPVVRPAQIPTFTVTSFPAPSGSGNAILSPNATGVGIDSPLFQSSALVTSDADPQSLAAWDVGYVQTIVTHVLRNEYVHTSAAWQVNTPIRDAQPGHQEPWYRNDSHSPVFAGGAATPVAMDDHPGHFAAWNDPRVHSPNSLARSARQLTLMAWLIAYNRVTRSTVFLKNIRWEINFIVNVDRSRPIASRAANAGPGMIAPVVGEGRGALSPRMSGDVYNTILNGAPNPRLRTGGGATQASMTQLASRPGIVAAPPAIRLNDSSGTGGSKYSPRHVYSTGSASGGAPLPPPIQLRLGQHFATDFSTVRVHTNTHAQQATRSLSARALTYGNHILLGPGEQTGDLKLMAHEAAHVVQQRGVPVPQGHTSAANDACEAEAHRASDAVVRQEPFAIQQRTGAARVQRLGLSDILDGLAELAANLPGFTLLTVIIGRNPINLRRVERNFTNILRGLMGLIPGGGEIMFQVINRYGIVARLGNWASEQVNALGLSYDYLRGRFIAFTDSLGLRDLFNPGGVWRRAENIFAEPVRRIGTMISRLIAQAITWLKETFMQPLSNFCREIPGYTLVTVLLGRDPFTNAPVERSPLNVVRAFAEFIPGGTEKVNQLVESRALQRAYEWFVQETQARNLTWARVTGTFSAAWNSLRLEDVLHPIDTLQRTVTMFRPLMSDLVSFAGAALMKLLELIFEAAMGAGGARILAILKRGRDTFLTIVRNPVGFLGNLLGAVGRGIAQFRTNILSHLRQGVISWLTGPVAAAGVQMPEQWDLRGIIWFVLQILGLTWPRVRQKLVRLMGDRVVATLESGFQLIQEIRERGLVQALRDRVTEFFGQLREAALGSIRSFIQQRLVMAGIQQLISLLSPVGAVIQAIVKTYTTIQFFIARFNQILDLVESIVNSIAAIAAGSIGAAANFIERTMARTIPVILDFLARFIGLGDVGGHVQRTIQGLQTRVDQMLDRAVEWIRTMAQRLVQTGVPSDPRQRLRLGLDAAAAAIRRLPGNSVGRIVIVPILAAVRVRYGFTRLEPEVRNGRWWIQGTINPSDGQDAGKSAASEPSAAQAGPEVGHDYLLKVRATFLHAKVTRKDVQRQEVELKHVFDDRKLTITPQALATELANPESNVVRTFDQVKWGDGKYKELATNDIHQMESRGYFATTQKRKVRNMNKGTATLKSDLSGTDLIEPLATMSAWQQQRAGLTPTGTRPDNEAQVDHIFPRTRGGYNSYANAQVLSFRENEDKLDDA
jgi:hypothetical protein